MGGAAQAKVGRFHNDKAVPSRFLTELSATEGPWRGGPCSTRMYDVDTYAILTQINPKQVTRLWLGHPTTHLVTLLDGYDAQFGPRSRTFQKNHI